MKLSRNPATTTLLGIFLFAAFAAGAAAAPPAGDADLPAHLAASAEGLPPDPCPFPPGCTGAASETAAPAAGVAPAAATEAPAAASPPSSDCGVEQLVQGPLLPKCGGCSPSPCANAALYSVCGSSGGQLMRCIDDGPVCPDTRPLCTCRTGPI